MLVVFFRAIFLYILIMFSIRLMGKRQLGELQPSELVITILISNIASLPIEDTNIPMILGVIPVLILVSFDILISNISLKSKGFRSFISGSPMIIIHDGMIDQKQLRKLRFSIDDLMESLRQSGIFDLQEVEYAIVETTGKVSVLQKCDTQSVTPKMLHIECESKAPPVVIISDGKLVESALDAYHIKKSWVYQMIATQKCTLNTVFLMTCNKDLDYYIVKKNR